MRRLPLVFVICPHCGRKIKIPEEATIEIERLAKKLPSLRGKSRGDKG